MSIHIAKFLILTSAGAALLGGVSSGAALGLGIAIALGLGNPYAHVGRKLTPRLLQLSIIGLGAGMNLNAVAHAGLQGAEFALTSILLTLLAGAAIGRLLGTERDSSLLINVGTAICGGSAIAAVAPVVRARPQAVSIALGTVFTLNAAGLLIFPWIGRQFGLSPEQFGLWCALAIHDTSSVVGAALQFGDRALEVGTTVKLARALWIVPLTVGISWWRERSGQEAATSTPKRPWFILGFVAAAALVTYVPSLEQPGKWVELAARRTLVLTLFLIGAGLTRETLREVGARPFAQGLLLWVLVASASLGSILFAGSIF